MKRLGLSLVLLVSLLLLSVGVAWAGPGSVRGTVYLDVNQNGQRDEGEVGVPGVYITISAGEYSHTYYTGDDGTYAPIPLPGGMWHITLHLPQGYKATTPTELDVYLPEGEAALGNDFGIYGSGQIQYPYGIGGGAPSTLPQTGTPEGTRLPLMGLLLLGLGVVILVGTPLALQPIRLRQR